MVHIRSAKTEDIPMLKGFIFEHGQNEWNYLPREEVLAHLSKIEIHEVQALIAEEAGTCLGFCSFNKELPEKCLRYIPTGKNKNAYLAEVVVHKSHSGKGIGSELVEAAKNVLKMQDIQALYAVRHTDNLGSAGMMRKSGFEVIAEFDDFEIRTSGSRRTSITRVELSNYEDIGVGGKLPISIAGS